MENDLNQTCETVENFVQKQTDYFMSVDESIRNDLNQETRELFEIIKKKEQIECLYMSLRSDFSNKR